LASVPSQREVEMHERVAREEANDRRVIVRIQIGGGLALVVSTFFAWMNHPILIHRKGASPAYFVREVSHTTGLTTVAGGTVAIALGALAVLTAVSLRNGRAPFGWFAVVLALGAVGDSVAEIVQLLLGRRNWLDHFAVIANGSAASPLANAIGAGVWLAACASIALAANALAYFWLSHRKWNEASSTP
jgi:hypothetical protein